MLMQEASKLRHTTLTERATAQHKPYPQYHLTKRTLLQSGDNAESMETSRIQMGMHTCSVSSHMTATFEGRS